MAYESLVALGVAFGFPIGSLLGNWTQDEGRALKKSNAAKLMKKFKYPLAAIYSGLLALFWYLGKLELGALLIFGIIVAQTSITDTKKLDSTTFKQGFLFLIVFAFFALIY